MHFLNYVQAAALGRDLAVGLKIRNRYPFVTVLLYERTKGLTASTCSRFGQSATHSAARQDAMPWPNINQNDAICVFTASPAFLSCAPIFPIKHPEKVGSMNALMGTASQIFKKKSHTAERFFVQK
jgi:hypothetical protein